VTVDPVTQQATLNNGAIVYAVRGKGRRLIEPAE